ncbi:putative bifunctional diguanylate cyclase/phosphodiesterase [Pararhizobium sp.]|uniref:putative bifunctional diguanylate cyclase/phosphodiesterase n=1 Tax=Pararhizobium sp. TaxID=1977563 RepID=UPI00271BA036|nr:EAL domain-containing protein [Pararhizobium sp.]MDO9414796.1 EAL domain-containing protein [Pararhizobium sp.]
MRIHSVENRFIAIVCAAMLLFVLPLVLVFLTLTSERVERERLHYIGSLLKANAEALSKPLWDLDTDSTRRIAESMAADGDILRVTIRDTSGAVSIVIPAETAGLAEPQTTMSAGVLYHSPNGVKTIGTAEIRVRSHSLLSRFSEDELTVLAILVFAAGIVFASAIIGNRITIIRPLMRLTDAIEATRRLGSRHHVDWTSADEMGTLAASFNEMQMRLAREESELKRAHTRATDIYNRTPAMLFSVDGDDRITAVSDYWLTATRYHRCDVIGKPFVDFLGEEFRDEYAARKIALADDLSVSEISVGFRCGDGSTMTVLILDTDTRTDGDDRSLSLSVMTDVTELKDAESRNHKQAITDHLTGLLNRQGFEAALDTNIMAVDDDHSQLACIFIDIDRFKWINDTYGHAAGDQVLRLIVDRVRPQLRPSDVMARLGGDEFAILIPSKDAQALAVSTCEIINTALNQLIAVGSSEVSVSASIGIALYPIHAKNAAELLLKSDMAMYARKRDGKNGTQLFDPSMLDNARERHEIEQHIEAGLKEDWFTAYLQPIVSLSDGRIAGFEALMRLEHPEKGVMPPAKIIGIAEENGSIIRIGDRIMQKAIENLSRISTLEGTQDTYLAINFSPLQFDTALPARLAAILMKNSIAPARIVIEITEAVLMLDSPEIHTILRQLSDFGCRIALDDFGTGYSSLSYLNRFPVDIVKVDQSFTRSLGNDAPDVRRKSRMLIKGIKTISHQMGCTVIAEGVETEDQWAALRKLGLDYGQGYLFSRPMPIDRMMEMLEQDSEPQAKAV